MKLRFFTLAMILIFSGIATAAGTDTPKDVNVVNTPNVKVVGKVQVDMDGEELTGAVEPEFEELTMTTILEPLIQFVENKTLGLELPSHTSTCPAPSMTLFGRVITLDFQCKVINNVGNFLDTVIIFFYSSLAFLIVIKA